MKNIYDALDGIDAQRVVALLEFEGVPAQVKGEYLAGAMGELPMQGLVSVWVADDDAPRARDILRTADPAPGLPEELDVPEAPPATTPHRGGSGLLGFVGVLLLGAAIGYAVAYAQLRSPHAEAQAGGEGPGEQAR